MSAADSRAHPAYTRTGAACYGLLLYQVFLQPAKDILDGNQGRGMSAHDEGLSLRWPTDRGACVNGIARKQTRANPRPGRMPAEGSAGDKPLHSARHTRERWPCANTRLRGGRRLRSSQAQRHVT